MGYLQILQIIEAGLPIIERLIAAIEQALPQAAPQVAEAKSLLDAHKAVIADHKAQVDEAENTETRN